MPSEPERRAADAPEVLRRAGPDDAAAIAEVFLSAFHAAYTFPLAHTAEQVRTWIRDEIVPGSEAWVASVGPEIVGLLVVGDGFIDHLYVRPDRWRKGIGRRLVALAKQRQTSGLDLYTFQENARARAFYEHLGFVAIWFGDGSTNEEGQPDVRYAWRP